MKILIADDDPIIRQVLINLLRKWEYEPVPTANGLEALNKLRRARQMFGEIAKSFPTWKPEMLQGFPNW